MNGKIKIGIMGAPGSFSEEAANIYCNREKINAEFVYLINAESVLKELEENKIDLGVMGVSNSISGGVLTTIRAMGKHFFDAIDIFQMNIRQNLLVRPGTKVEEIDMIVSQLPALDQCKNYLQQKFPKAKILEYEDTAKAARDLAEDVLPKNAAAIANINCAKLFGLEVYEENIQDNKDNRTTFVVVKK